ncbi:MAG: acyltransferase family protein [Oscillospiraceae bacterium]
MKTSNRINSIDIVRLFAAIFVIAIHTQAIIMWFPSRANGNIQILTRVAVPFFFCTSGYFLQKGYVRKGCSAIVATIWKLIKVYVSVSLAYFAFIFLQNPALLREPKKWMLIDFLFNGSYYHLWYMVGVIYSTVMIYLICKFKLTKALLPLAVLLLCCWPFGNVVLWHRQ